ncbi:uncharacterized protein LOC125027742 [Penaeus chinensis]|uniref:uncharacterized protein LOC125027742 n=1 Tax=Penaeus chinensis TaxID=139456 RepID=UPI001FB5A572|nr:uncharacterized protein LOC125027742 [Penaeus chinensis]
MSRVLGYVYTTILSNLIGLAVINISCCTAMLVKMHLHKRSAMPCVSSKVMDNAMCAVLAMLVCCLVFDIPYYIICWITDVHNVLFTVADIVYDSQFCVNPVVYTLVNHLYRRRVSEAMRRWWQRAAGGRA